MTTSQFIRNLSEFLPKDVANGIATQLNRLGEDDSDPEVRICDLANDGFPAAIKNWFKKEYEYHRDYPLIV